MLNMVIEIIAVVAVCGALFSWSLVFTKAVSKMSDELEPVVSKRA